MRVRLIIASNRLPVNIDQQPDGGVVVSRTAGGLATALQAIFRAEEALWVGWTGMRGELASKLKKVAFPKGLVPVEASVELVEAYYDRISNRLLWPILHSLESHYVFTKKDWQAYRTMAQHFAERIQKLLRPNDVIWVHDYHLLLLPAALRKLGVTNRIGFFCHTTFPPAKHLMQIPPYHELLESLCQVEVLGLQSERDVTNFWDCLRASDIHNQPGLVRAFPIGIDYEAFRKEVQQSVVRREVGAARQWLGGKKLILSISRLDYTKGILDQLRMVEAFLEKAVDREQYMYKLVVAPSRETVSEYTELRAAIVQAVEAINRRLGTATWQPIAYAYQTFSFDDMVTWLSIADVLLLAPRADGMNLIAKEYIAAHRAGPGVLVISNATGAAFQLEEALQFGAGNIEQGAATLGRAFSLSEPERAKRWQALQVNVRDQNVHWWAERFLHALRRDDN